MSTLTNGRTGNRYPQPYSSLLTCYTSAEVPWVANQPTTALNETTADLVGIPRKHEGHPERGGYSIITASLLGVPSFTSTGPDRVIPACASSFGVTFRKYPSAAAMRTLPG